MTPATSAATAVGQALTASTRGQSVLQEMHVNPYTPFGEAGIRGALNP